MDKQPFILTLVAKIYMVQIIEERTCFTRFGRVKKENKLGSFNLMGQTW